MFGFRKKKPQPRIEVIEEDGQPLPDGPLRSAILRSFETGEEVIWNEGDPEPKHSGR